MRTIVVLPTYNEALNITAMLASITGSALRPDVLVVDDSSPDGTGQLVEKFALDLPGRVQLLTRAGKQGLGAAYRAGFAAAVPLGYDAVVQMDADGSHPVSALVHMARRVEAGDDLVIGSRYVPGGGLADDWPWRRRVLSRAGNLYARALLRVPVRDLTGGFKMWRTSMLAAADLSAATAAGYGFQIQMTLAAMMCGARVSEVPILFVDRELGESKMHSGIVVEAMGAVLAMRADAARVRAARPPRPVRVPATAPVPLDRPGQDAA